MGAVALGLACGLGLLLAAPTSGAEEPVAPPEAESQEPAFVPIAEIGGQADSAEARLREMRMELSSAELQERVEASLPETQEEITSRTAELSSAVREVGEVVSTLPSPGEAPESQIRFSLLVATDIDADQLRARLEFPETNVRSVR